MGDYNKGYYQITEKGRAYLAGELDTDDLDMSAGNDTVTGEETDLESVEIGTTEETGGITGALYSNEAEVGAAAIVASHRSHSSRSTSRLIGHLPVEVVDRRVGEIKREAVKPDNSKSLCNG